MKSYAIDHVSVYSMCVCVTKYQLLSALSVKNVQKGTHAAFLSHLDIVNVTVDCRFTPGQALLPFLCSYMYLCAVPPLGCGVSVSDVRCVAWCSYSHML